MVPLPTWIGIVLSLTNSTSPNEQPAALCSFLNPGHDAICEAYSGLCDQVTWGNSIKLENAFDIAADICSREELEAYGFVGGLDANVDACHKYFIRV
jgi:hypothetical protein